MTRSLVQGRESMLVDETDAQSSGRELSRWCTQSVGPRIARGTKEVR